MLDTLGNRKYVIQRMLKQVKKERSKTENIQRKYVLQRILKQEKKIRKQNRQHKMEIHSTENPPAKKVEDNKTQLDKARGIDNQIKIGKNN